MTTDAITEWNLLTEAHEALLAQVKAADAADWNRPTPCEDWTVAQVLQHAAGDQLAFAAMITGGEGPAENPFAPSGTLTEDPVRIAQTAIEAAAAAWGTIAKDAQAVPVPVPPNSLDAPTGVGACALDAAVHAWDIARAIGRPNPLAPHVAAELLPVAEQIVEPLRAYGAYAPALAPQEGDDPTALLLRYLGRNPEWTA